MEGGDEEGPLSSNEPSSLAQVSTLQRETATPSQLPR